MATPTTRSPSSSFMTRTPRVLRFWMEISETFVRITIPDSLITMISASSETAVEETTTPPRRSVRMFRTPIVPLPWPRNSSKSVRLPYPFSVMVSR